MSEPGADILAFAATTADETFVLREDEFRLLYERTSRALWLYLWRLTRDGHVADDLLQETYYRFLRTPGTYESERHERNTLYRIATNLVRDARRRARPLVISIEEPANAALAGTDDAVHAAGDRTDVQRALAQLKERDQQLLWLAYAEGSTHKEIAASLGLRTGSVKTLLFRARQRLAALLPRAAAAARRAGGDA
jgi:RNA polymerase sigma-70 factor (ECF subfamily)